MLHFAEAESLRASLCDLQNSIRDALIQERRDEWALVVGQTSADTIYALDRVSEAAISRWFGAHWPAAEPVELIMEGLEDGEVVTFPPGTPVEATKWKCILDPVDGTRGLMYDKRSAWSLAGLAPQRGAATNLADICVAAMTELPTSKAYLADQVSGVVGCGRDGLVCERVNILNGARESWTPRPSTAGDFRHGFAALARFFPEGKALLSRVEEELWGELVGLGAEASPVVFDDQYISSGGQLFEILVGHDRMQGDLRPLAYAKLGLGSTLVCHPYDICTAFLLREAGGVVEGAAGEELCAPLDTLSAVCWVGFANERLAASVRPVLRRLIETHLS